MCDFYYSATSPPCRSVQMVAKYLGVELNLKPLNIYAQEHLTPEFLKINPQHTIPTLVDNGFSVWESRAILVYLAEKYGKNDSLYPKDPQKRAIVNQRLYFDMQSYQRFFEYFIPMFRGEPADPEKLKKVEEALEFLDLFLSKTKFVAGDSLTIADYAMLATYSTIVVGGSDVARFTNIARWYELRTDWPGNEINEASFEAIREMVKKQKSGQAS